MKRKNHIWIVVADGAHALFFAPNDDIDALVPAGPAALDSAPVRLRTRQLKGDRPGRSFSSSRGGARHAIEPKHDYHKLEKHNFSVAVAVALETAHKQRAFSDLVLVAPRRSLGEFRQLLPQGVRASIREEIPNDLTRSSAAALWKKLAPAVGRIYRAAARAQ